MAGWYPHAKWKDKPCAVCGTSFTPRSGAHKFCSSACKGKWKYVTGIGSTENQYTAISGNWRRYLSRLLAKRKEHSLTVDNLLELLEKQQYRCSLSGRPLTCDLKKGSILRTNASIDRIIAGGAYAIDNVHLVCRALNYWRYDTPLSEYVDWCRAVAQHYETHASQVVRGEGAKSYGETA